MRLHLTSTTSSGLASCSGAHLRPSCKLPVGYRSAVGSTRRPRPLQRCPQFRSDPNAAHAKDASAPGATQEVLIPRLPKGPVVGPELIDLINNFKRLQNGSDVRGIAIGGVPKQPITLTPGIAHFIGYSFAKWLEGPVCVSVGSDPRISGPMLEAALVSGIAAAGGCVDTFGIATTPCMFYSIVANKRYHGAIMLTASHMPFNSNGLKFFTEAGGLEKADVAELLQGAAQACAQVGVLPLEPLSEGAHLIRTALAVRPEQISRVDFLPAYAAFLRGLIKQGVASKDNRHFPLAGLKIVVDAGNGSGGFFAEQVLAPLGADTAGSRFLDPDGSFPNHIPNPENAAAMKSGREAVLEAGADLGIVFDTDVDRSAIVDSSGEEINSNRFIALMSSIVLRDHPGTTIVTDSVTSNGLTEFIVAAGGQHCRWKRGYKNVISKGVELNRAGVECHLMMETSGHGAVKDNWYLDDGAYLAVQVVIEMVRRREAGLGGIGTFLSQLREAREVGEVRIRIDAPSGEYKALGVQAVDLFRDWVEEGGAARAGWALEPVNHEGWRVAVDEGEGRRGWLLLRQSLHDPLLVLNAESEVEGGVAATKAALLRFFEERCAGMPLDLSGLRGGQAA